MKVIFILISTLLVVASSQNEDDTDEKIEKMMDTVCGEADVKRKLIKCAKAFPAHLYHSISSCTGNPNMKVEDLLTYFCEMEESVDEESFDECLAKNSKDEIQSGAIRPEEVLAIVQGCMDIVQYGKSRGWDILWKKIEEGYD